MKIMLADNIRKLRKEMLLTQEQFAEVLGVTTGAVYKWEAGLSYPELSLIVKIANFFDTSVDVLLGYEVKDNRMAAIIERLEEYTNEKNPAGMEEAEMALKKYPHSFELVHLSASMYSRFAMESGNKEQSQRALELMQQALLLISQNKNPEISEETIQGKIADILMSLGKYEEALDVLKKYNSGGRYNGRIGLSLSESSEHVDEAAHYLSEALWEMIASFTQIISGFTTVYSNKKDYSSLKELLIWGSGFLSSLCEDGKTSVLDKLNSGLQAALAATYLKLGKKSEARVQLENALKLARRFDENPSYDPKDVRFVATVDKYSVYDSFGITAFEGLEKLIESQEDKKLSSLWKEIKKNEK